jgi:hypothetical protein
MENFADVVNEITYLCVTIVPWGCQSLKKGEPVVTMATVNGPIIRFRLVHQRPEWTRG